MKFRLNPITVILLLGSFIALALGIIVEGCTEWKYGCYNNGVFIALIIWIVALGFSFETSHKDDKTNQKEVKE